MHTIINISANQSIHTKHLLRENHAGLRLGCPSFMMITVSGPLGWLLSQILLLAYFKLDNGSNVCGLEFDFDNKGAWKKLEVKKENEEENSTNRDSHESRTKEDDTKSKGDNSTSTSEDKPSDIEDIESRLVCSSSCLKKMLRSDFEATTEEGR